jgi:hypothetical protein
MGPGRDFKSRDADKANRLTTCFLSHQPVDYRPEVAAEPGGVRERNRDKPPPEKLVGRAVSTEFLPSYIGRPYLDNSVFGVFPRSPQTPW